MQETYRLLRESFWFLEAMADAEYPPHLLRIQRDRLMPQIERQIAAMEADDRWSSQNDEVSVLLVQRLPDDWSAQVLEPSRPLRYAGRSPVVSGHRLHVLAESISSLSSWTRTYNGVLFPPQDEAATTG